MKKEYEMTEEELKDILDACKPVPYMIFNGREPISQQERANAAWARLGKKHNFNYMTVSGVPGKSNRFFLAEPIE